jgi:alpha-beta hydrolase superfamily lysophospholipase
MRRKERRAMAFDRRFLHSSPTGATLNLHVNAAKATARGVIQINHGMAEHAARYGRFADAAAERGYHVYAHDHRGHGATRAPDAPARSFAWSDGAKKVIGDIVAVHDLIAVEQPGLPVLCFGHSMGANLSLGFALAHSERIAALALWNSDFSPGWRGSLAQLLLSWERLRRGSDAPSAFMARLGFRAWSASIAGRRTDFDWLSLDADEVRKYVEDPLCGWDASVGMWRDVLEMARRGANEENLARMRRDLPLHLAGGADDPVTRGGETVRDLARRLGRMGFRQITCVIHPRTRHESLNETGRDRITAEFLDWVDEALETGERRHPAQDVAE